MSVRWRAEECSSCGVPMEASLVMVTEATRLIDDTIGLKSPPMGKFCSVACLGRWVGVQVRILPPAASIAKILDEELGGLFPTHIVLASLFDDETLHALATRLRARLQAE